MPTERPQLRILLVEDHPDSRFALTRLLQLLGYRVEAAAGAAAARELARTLDFDLLLCDLGLPDGDGCDLMRELSEMYRFKGIAVTGYGSPNDLKASERAGFAAHLLKPVTLEKLDDALRKASPFPATSGEIAVDRADLPPSN